MPLGNPPPSDSPCGFYELRATTRRRDAPRTVSSARSAIGHQRFYNCHDQQLISALMETFTLMIWLIGNAASPPSAKFPGLTEYQCEYWRAELSQELPKAASLCQLEQDGQAPSRINPVDRYWEAPCIPENGRARVMPPVGRFCD